MCELFAKSSAKPADVTLSLQVLAEHGGKTGPHKDGWGIAYFHGAYARLIKDARAASQSDWVDFVESRSLTSSCVIAHIRNASQGEVALRNTHPFARELAGRMHVFAHNGTLHGLEGDPRFRLDHYHPIGTTDSERAFCALLTRLAAIWLPPTEPPPLERRLEVFAGFAADARGLGPANFLYGDGDYLFAHANKRHHNDGRFGPPALHLLRRTTGRSGRAMRGAGVTISCEEQEILVLASVPLTDEAWRPLSDGEVLALRGGEIVAGARLDPAPGT